MKGRETVFQDLGFAYGAGFVRGDAYMRLYQLDDYALRLAYFDTTHRRAAVHYEVAAYVSDHARMIVTVNGELASERYALADLAAALLRHYDPALSTTTARGPILVDQTCPLFGKNYWVRIQFQYSGRGDSGDSGEKLVHHFADKLMLVYGMLVVQTPSAAELSINVKEVVDLISQPDQFMGPLT